MSNTGARVTDSLGDRMKGQYEDRSRYFLPRRTYTIIRVDGKSFHSYTRRMKRPYDLDLMKCMDATALALVGEFQGSELAYIQSDEISVLLTDFSKPETCAAFDGNLQKLASVSASVASTAFNIEAMACGFAPHAVFDSRVFVIPDPVEVENYFIWRQKDAERNSVAMLAQNYASPKQLHGKGIPEQHDIIHAAGDNWNNHPARYKRGGAIIYADMKWQCVDPPIFTQERAWLEKLIPRMWAKAVEP